MKNPFSLPRKSTFGLFLIVFAIFFSQVIWNGTFFRPNAAQAQNLEQALAASRNNPHVRAAMAAQEKHSARIMSIPDVVGHGIGSSPDGEPNITIFVMRAGVPGIPATIEGVSTEVEVTGMIVAYTDTTDRLRPVPIGVSTGHPDITAGTIGCRVKDAYGNVYALSNNHVYANQNDAVINEDNVLQPGAYDGGIDSDDAIGTLDDFEPIDFSGGNNTMDAAIAIISSGVDLLCSTPSDDGYGTPSSSTVNASVDQKVQKYGRTTKLTHGKVSAIDATVDVCYETRGPVRCVKSARFVDQIAIIPVTPATFSAGGDSGSLIVTDDTNKNPVALLFAGSSTHTFANPIDLVLARFDVTVDDYCPDPCDNPDKDGDLYNDEACGGTDCDDTDFYVNPGVTEVCDDGVDNNCDGNIDEGCSTCLPKRATCSSNSDCCSGKCRRGICR